MDRGGRARTPRREAAGLATGLLVMGVFGLLVISRDHALGWDEAVYAVWARGIATDAPIDDVVGIYRPPGLPLLGAGTHVVGLTDQGLRLVSLALGLLAIAGVWALARTVFGGRTALLALVVTVGTQAVVRELPLFHNDLPSTGALLWLMTLLWSQFTTRRRPGPALLLAAPMAAAAFYLRFGVLAALVGIALVVVVLWWRTLGRARVLAGLTLGSTVILLLPHALYAITERGVPWGVLTAAADVTNTTGPLAAMVAYLGMLPRTLAGPAAVSFVVAGVLLSGRCLLPARASGTPTGVRRRVAFLSIPATFAAGATIAVSHPEPRYLLFPALLFVIVGAHGVRRGYRAVVRRAGRGRERRIRLATGALVVLLVGAVVGRELWTETTRPARGAWYRQTARAIGRVAGDGCVIAATRVPAVAWYSGCSVHRMASSTPAALLQTAATSRWVLLTSEDDDRIGKGHVDPYRALVAGSVPFATTTAQGGWATAYHVGR
ncbi:MAG TPA: glycosyltransferase family 39 protein [Candidatus Limnocylindrales bacterium]|nr:glycosyltransferase family 39 protein [Candidatus Limnocylindrales bacterium]